MTTGTITDFFPQARRISCGVVRLGLQARIYSGGTPDKSKVEYWEDGDIPWIGSGAVNQGTVTQPTAHITRQAVDNSSTRLFSKNSLIMALAGQGKTKGMVAQMGIDAYGNQSLGCISDYQGERRFLFWWLTSLYREIRNLSSGETRDGLNQSMLGQIPVPLLDFATQCQIADFLDRETARIDLLIEKKRRFVELLAIKEAAFIESVVTDGFRIKPSSKPVRFENGWSSLRLKNISSRLRVGVVVNPSDYIDDNGDIPFLYGGNIREYSIDFVNCRRMARASSRRLHASRLNSGDVVVVRVGAPGVAAVIPDSVSEANCASVMCVTTKACSGEWLAFAFNSRFVRYQVEVVQYGAAQKQFNLEHAREFIIPVPPPELEAKLVGQMNLLRGKNKAIVAKTQVSIERTKEYRSALITAAVTGQFDVMSYAQCGRIDQSLVGIQEEMGA